PQKMMFGPCRGGAVRLTAPGDVLMIGEGIETCLTAMQATGHPAWAALSTSGLRALDLIRMGRSTRHRARSGDLSRTLLRLRWVGLGFGRRPFASRAFPELRSRRPRLC